MCSRFELSANPRDLAAHFRLPVVPDHLPSPVLRPTDPVAVLLTRDIGAAPVCTALSWGLVVQWDPKPLINARSETLDSKPTFRPLVQQRCVVPASAWFEWRKDGRQRRKNRIARRDSALIGFAGLYAVDAEAARVTIITGPSPQEVAHVHDRAPICLDEAALAAWLDPHIPFADVRDALIPQHGRFAAEEEPVSGSGQRDLFG